MATVNGIDISNWQPNDVSGLPGAGYTFVIVKATEGTGYTDPTFTTKWANAKAAGLVRGAYHFLRPDLGNTAAGEAAWFLSVVKPRLQPGDIVALDVEKGAGDLSAYVQTFLDTVAASIGFNPMLYANLDYLQNHGLENKPGLGKYGLWLADWGIPQSSIPNIPGWAFVAMWQNGSAYVPGQGTVDHDIFFGDRPTLLKYGMPTPAPAPVPVPVDPCQSVKDQLAAAQAQVTTLTNQVSTLTAANTALSAKISAAKTALG